MRVGCDRRPSTDERVDERLASLIFVDVSVCTRAEKPGYVGLQSADRHAAVDGQANEFGE
jgi:hypothetical protein